MKMKLKNFYKNIIIFCILFHQMEKLKIYIFIKILNFIFIVFEFKSIYMYVKFL